jgi:hypothetical protein
MYRRSNHERGGHGHRRTDRSSAASQSCSGLECDRRQGGSCQKGGSCHKDSGRGKGDTGSHIGAGEEGTYSEGRSRALARKEGCPGEAGRGDPGSYEEGSREEGSREEGSRE